VVQPPPPARARASEARFASLVTLAYLAVVAWAALAHEPWRDEMEAWLVARDAASPLGLFSNLRYEGHPVLWYVILWPLTRLGGPGLMQAAAVALGGASTYLFARLSPFPRWARVLFAFGALQVWEWGAIARNYGLSAALLFAAAALLVRRERHPLWLGLVLALGANASAHGAIVAGGLLAVLVVERLSPWRDPARAAPAPAFWGGVALAAAGQIAGALTMVPPADSAIRFLWAARTLGDRIGKTVAAPFHGIATLPWADPLDPHVVLRAVQISIGVAATLAFLAAAIPVLARRRGAWLAAAIPCGALLGLFYLRWYGGERHAGFLFLSLLLALWIAPSFPARAGAPGRLGRLAERALAPALAAVLLCQVGGSILQASLDARGLYSAARATAALVRERGLEALPMVADPDAIASNVVGMLGKRAAFYENVERWGSYPIFDARHAPDRPHPDHAPDEAVFRRARSLARDSAVVVVIDREASPAAAALASAELVGFRRADVRVDESFWVYLVPRSGEAVSSGAAR
jgi:hypothetical protein